MPKYPFFWMSIHNDFLKKNRKDVINLIKTYIDVNRYIVKHKAKTLAVAKKHMKVKPKYLSKGYDTLLDLKSWSQNDGVTKEAFDFVVTGGLDYKQLMKKLSSDQFVDTSFQDAALKAMAAFPKIFPSKTSKAGADWAPRLVFLHPPAMTPTRLHGHL
ncbi:MAG: hypothetical protein HN720_02020 [Nitrospinaceae bacterium]|nr:hypothetical protein [Nitrospinaceae bacterium]MBT7855680.1 hypothetical protein [Nitrospinaceae bacterium]